VSIIKHSEISRGGIGSLFNFLMHLEDEFTAVIDSDCLRAVGSFRFLFLELLPIIPGVIVNFSAWIGKIN